MAQPNSTQEITSPPAAGPFQPYDATAGDNTRPWVKLERNAGPASINTGRVSGEFEDGPGPWRQC